MECDETFEGCVVLVPDTDTAGSRREKPCGAIREVIREKSIRTSATNNRRGHSRFTTRWVGFEGASLTGIAHERGARAGFAGRLER